MLNRINRLTLKKDFSEVFRYGKTYESGGVLLKIKKNSLDKTRIGLSIGVRYSPKAVGRNLAKRQTRAFFRKYLSRIKPGFDIIVSLRGSQGKTKQQNNFSRDLSIALEKAKISLNNE